jgi:hypothetical protein
MGSGHTATAKLSLSLLGRFIAFLAVTQPHIAAAVAVSASRLERVRRFRFRLAREDGGTELP